MERILSNRAEFRFSRSLFMQVNCYVPCKMQQMVLLFVLQYKMMQLSR